MENRVWQSTISIMAADKEIKSLSVEPCFGFHIRDRTPGERPLGDGLIEPIYPERVVRAGAAEQATILAIGDVAECAGINQKPLSANGETDAESVGMTMTRTTRPLRSGIDHHLLNAGGLVLANVVDEINPSQFKSLRCWRRLNARPLVELDGFFAEQPDSFLGEAGGSVI